MRVAISVWNQWVAPLFDVAAHLLLVDVEGTDSRQRELINVESLTLYQRMELLKKLRVSVLVCGGITHPTLETIQSYRMKTIPFICGDVETVLNALVKGIDVENVFSMPGETRKEG